MRLTGASRWGASDELSFQRLMSLETAEILARGHADALVKALA